MKNFLKFIGLIFVIIIIASAINSVSKDKNSNVSVDTDKKRLNVKNGGIKIP